MKRILVLLACGLYLCSATAQNLNTTLRAKMTFPGQTLANVWGYKARDGHEYALLGGAKGLIIVDITNPDAPQQIVQIPGPNNLWKEIKTYSHFAYVVSEGGQGIQVVDLGNLPSPNLNYHYYKGDGVIANQLGRIHALHIDVKKGYLYAYGGNLFGGGAKIFSLKKDPYNPVYVAKYDQLGYIHDGYVENDTMYSGHINSGIFAMVDMRNKMAPQLLATEPTPLARTHNTWLTDDHKSLLITDETFGSYLASYDVSDPTDIKLLDKIQSGLSTNSSVHNTHILKNWAVTSWYTDGITIVDVTRPDNLVQMGNYDTYPGAGSSYEGCWGVYPFFPSGNLIASNINAQNTGDGELLIITPEYHRASYLEGTVYNAQSNIPLSGVTVEILNSAPAVEEISANNGSFKTGMAATGYFTVRISKLGYQTFQTVAWFGEGEVVNLNVGLYPNDLLTVTGTVFSELDGLPVADAQVTIDGPNYSGSFTTDAEGAFNFNNVKPGNYFMVVSAAGFAVKVVSGLQIVADRDISIRLSQFGHKPGRIEGFVCTGNPFRDQTVIRYSLPADGFSMQLTDSGGKLIESRRVSGSDGELEIGRNLPRGMYFLRLETPGLPAETLQLVKTE